MTVQNLFTAISTAIAAITQYDAAKHIKNKQTAKRVGAALTGMSLLSPLPLVFNSCKQLVSGEETPTIINKPYHNVMGDTTIVVEGVPVDMDGKLTSVFAEFQGSLPSAQKNKIRSWAARAGAKIVILENPGFNIYAN
jgi:hypothetical protein